MKLESGVIAPKFEAKDFLGKSIKIDDYEGNKILLTFFRGASCTFSNLRIKKLIQNQKRLEDKGLKIIVLFASSASDIKKYIEKYNASFPIIYDPELEIYEQYGIESSSMVGLKTILKGIFNFKTLFEKPLIPADFLINKEGVIEKSHYGSDFGDHMDLKDIICWSN